MNESIRVLVVDDSENDTLLLVDELRDNGYDTSYLRIDTEEAMRAAIREQTWDIIIADYTMPRFSGPAALQTLSDSGLDIPLILVSGTAQDHSGIDMMRAGAKDFIVKHSLSRLAPAVARELREADVRRERSLAEAAARTSAENYRMMFEYAPAAIVAFDSNGVILQVNPIFEQLYGFSAEEVVGRRVVDTFGRPEDAERAHEIAARVFDCEAIRNAEWQDVRKDGTTIHVLANVTPVCSESGEITMALAMITDITERKLALEREREQEAHKREFYRRTILAFTAGKLVIAEPEEIARLADDSAGSWEVDSLEDLGKMRTSVKQILLGAGMDEQRVYNFVGAIVEAATNAFKHAGGGRASLHLHPETVVFAVSDSGPGIEALALPDVALTKGYSTAATLGMGYKVMIEFADRVYLDTGPEGTTVAIEMKLREERSIEDAILEKAQGW